MIVEIAKKEALIKSTTVVELTLPVRVYCRTTCPLHVKEGAQFRLWLSFHDLETAEDMIVRETNNEILNCGQVLNTFIVRS